MRLWHARVPAYAILSLLCAGCAVETHQRFEGRLTGLSTDVATERQIDSGLMVGVRNNAVSLFAMRLADEGGSFGCFVILYAPESAEGMGRLSTESIKETWQLHGPAMQRLMPFGPGNGTEFAKLFASGGETERRQVEGAVRLVGNVEVRRYRSNLDYKIHVSLHSDPRGDAEISGTFRAFETWHFRPFTTLALMASD